MFFFLMRPDRSRLHKAFFSRIDLNWEVWVFLKPNSSLRSPLVSFLEAPSKAGRPIWCPNAPTHRNISPQMEIMETESVFVSKIVWPMTEDVNIFFYFVEYCVQLPLFSLLNVFLIVQDVQFNFTVSNFV